MSMEITAWLSVAAAAHHSSLPSVTLSNESVFFFFFTYEASVHQSLWQFDWLNKHGRGS